MEGTVVEVTRQIALGINVIAVVVVVIGVVGAIRLLLSYSLDRDMDEIGQRQRADETRIATGVDGAAGA